MEIEYKKANLKLPCSFILASGSPRRKELLSRLIPDFKVIPSTAEEIKSHQDGPVSLISENALSTSPSSILMPRTPSTTTNTSNPSSSASRAENLMQ